MSAPQAPTPPACRASGGRGERGQGVIEWVVVAGIILCAWTWAWQFSCHAFMATGARLLAVQQAREGLAGLVPKGGVSPPNPWRATGRARWAQEHGMQELRIPQRRAASLFSSFFSGFR